MIHKFTPVSRRKFLHKGIGMSALFLLNPGKSSLLLAQRANEDVNSSSDANDDLFTDVVQRYGSEFGNIQPVKWRSHHGRV